MPFVDKVVLAGRRKALPYWNKFLQGYYDPSGSASISSTRRYACPVRRRQRDAEMKRRAFACDAVDATTGYVAFNWSDRLVGGSSDRARKLRHAISIAFDVEEQIIIFANGRGIPAQGPIAPGIFGYREGKEGVNPVVYDWADGKAERKSIEQAKRLLAEAGYPEGRDAKTGQPVVIYFDTVVRGAGDKAVFDWYRRQFEKLSLQLVIRDTDWNRFQEKIRKGDTQMFRLGWNADYPDPENFLFLLHGPQSRAKFQGENAANYVNPEYDALFDKMKNMPNSPERQQIIDRMVEIARVDAPWIWGTHPKRYSLRHSWIANDKPNTMARNNLKYLRIDPQKRAEMRAQWNRPVLWPLGLILAALVAFSVPAFVKLPKARAARSKAEPLDARLHRAPRPVRHPDPHRRQPHYLCPLLRRQHARRHGAHAARHAARDAGCDREVEGGAGLRQAPAVELAGRRGGQAARHDLL